MKINTDYVIIILLVGIIILLLFKSPNLKIEGMSSTVNPEALANLASMYKNGELKVSKLEVTGDIIAGGTGTFGNAKIGSSKKNGPLGSSYAEVSHKDHFGTKYSIGMNGFGTWINGHDGVYIRNRNSNRFSIPTGNTSSLTGNINVSGVGTFGPIQIGTMHANTGYSGYSGISYGNNTPILATNRSGTWLVGQDTLTLRLKGVNKVNYK